MDIYVARQPIFSKSRKVVAYELLFRESMENYMPDIDGDSATSSVLSSSFLNLGIDSLSGGRKVFINFTKNLLVHLIPVMFPKKVTIVEIIETIQPDEDVIAACRTLKKKGYTLALDDYVFDPEMKPFLDVIDIVKVEFFGTPLEEIREKVKKLPSGIKLLAEKIETWEEFRGAVDMGFKLFQGYFFCKPEVVKGREVPATSMALIEIMREVNNKEIDFDIITAQISKDVLISYKLLRYINSAYFKRIQQITSIKNALVYLGENELRRFISVILMANLASAGTAELAISSCVRARFCELAGDALNRVDDKQELFTLGLFSLIDAILDQPMSKVMEHLPLSDRITSAFLNETGEFALFLRLAIDFEKGAWAKVDEGALKIGIDPYTLPELYKSAVEWADTLRSV